MNLDTILSFALVGKANKRKKSLRIVKGREGDGNN
jgi:hypothetical protein